MSVTQICLHCGFKMPEGKKKFCQYCDTPEKRKEMDKNNRKVFADAGLKEYECEYCIGKKSKKLLSINE